MAGGGKDGVAVGGEEESLLPAIERAEIDAAGSTLGGGSARLALPEKERPVIGKKKGQRWVPCWNDASAWVTGTGVRPAAGTCTRVLWRSGAKTMTPRAFHVPPRPVGALATSCEGHRRYRLLQLAVGEECEVPAIGRPERKGCALGPLERRRRRDSSGRTQSIGCIGGRVGGVGAGGERPVVCHRGRGRGRRCPCERRSRFAREPGCRSVWPAQVAMPDGSRPSRRGRRRAGRRTREARARADAKRVRGWRRRRARLGAAAKPLRGSTSARRATSCAVCTRSSDLWRDSP